MAPPRAGDAPGSRSGRQRSGSTVKGFRRDAEAGPRLARGGPPYEKGSLEAMLRAPSGREGRSDLSGLRPDDTDGYAKKSARRKLARDQERLDALQQILYADHSRRVLIVLQGMDTSGKDGTIRHVMRSLNPQGVQVASFKKPTEEEKQHHFLWRIEKALPGPGMIGIFNRSHYEDVLVPTAHRQLTSAQLDARYEEIRAFEKGLAREGVTILKFFLHISRAEQKRRLEERLEDPDKRWKFSPQDVESRALWPRFAAAYESLLARTNDPWAPWFVVPADHKWYRDFVVGRVLKHALKRMDLKYPEPPPGLDRIKIPD